jgi:hypothetical protein
MDGWKASRKTTMTSFTICNYTPQDWLPRWNPTSSQWVPIHNWELWEASNEMVHWSLLAHIGWLFSGVHDSVTNLMGGKNKVMLMYSTKSIWSHKLHLELCARHCFLKKSRSDKTHVKMPKLCSTQLQSYALLSPTCISLPRLENLGIQSLLDTVRRLKRRGGDIPSRKRAWGVHLCRVKALGWGHSQIVGPCARLGPAFRECPKWISPSHTWVKGLHEAKVIMNLYIHSSWGVGGSVDSLRARWI